jgi:hypothetical protein
MEFDVGIHGESGRRRFAMMSADEIAEEAVRTVAGELDFKGNAIIVRPRRRTALALGRCRAHCGFAVECVTALSASLATFLFTPFPIETRGGARL